MAVMLGRNTYAAALVVTKVERPVTSIGGPPSACGITKMLSAGFWVPISGSFDFGFSLTAPANSAVIYPTSQHELILIFDVRVNEIEENPALDAIVRFTWIIGRPVRQTATNQPVRIIAAAGLPLASDWLASWIEAAYVCTDGTADPLRISRTISIHIVEIVQLFGRNPSRRAICVW